MSRLKIASAVGLLFGMALPGFAASLSIDSVVGSFFNPFGTGGDETVLYYDANTEARWGNNPQGDERTSRSGLRFDGEAPPAFITLDNVLFKLGTLTHFNHPIDDPISRIDMNLSLGVSNGGPVTAGPFAFRYGVDETLNSDACNNLGVCTMADDDLISIAALSPLTNTFTIGTTTYLLAIEGFSTDGGNTITNALRSAENADNSAGLYARFFAQPGDPTVPEPSSMILVGGGLLAAAVRFAKSRRAA